MAQPGFSLSELITAIASAKKVYDSFFHTYDSAPARIKELTETLRYFRDTLIDLETILRHYGTFYHGQLTFTRKLDECEAFLREYSELRPENPAKPNESRQTTLQKVRRVWQTTKMAFDDATTSLGDGLSMELHKLNNFLFLFILKQTVPGEQIAVSSQRSANASNRPPSSRSSDTENFGRLLRQLQGVRNSLAAELDLARRSGREPDFSTIYPVLENAWYLLCHEVGFIGETIPQIQREGLLHSSQRSSGLIGSNYDSEISITDNEFPSFADQNRAKNRIGTVSIEFEMKTEKETNKKGGKMIGIIQRYSFEFQKYSLSQGEEGPVFIWTDQGTSSVLRHYIPMKVFPHTLNRAVGNPLQITFLEKEKHRLVLEKHNEIALDSTPLLIGYQFTLGMQHQQFQEDLRNKDLLNTFEFYHIKSKRSGKYCEATNQDLKLWRSRDYHQLHSLSFNSNTVERRHIEFPICWFDGTMDRDRGKCTVTLYFVQRTSRSLPPVDSKKRWPRLPKLPLRRTKSNETSPAPLLTPVMPVTPAPQHCSQASLYDIEISSTYSNDHRFAPSDIATDLNFLFIEFSSPDHYTNFINEFDRVYKLDTPSETFAPPNLALVKEDPQEFPEP